MLHLNCECNLHDLVPLLSWTSESKESLQFTSCSLFSCFNASSVLTHGERKLGLTDNRTQNMRWKHPTLLYPPEPYGLTPLLTCLPTCWLIRKRGKHTQKGKTHHHGFMLRLLWWCVASHATVLKLQHLWRHLHGQREWEAPAWEGKQSLFAYHSLQCLWAYANDKRSPCIHMFPIFASVVLKAPN